MNPDVIVKALRCSATQASDCKRDCPYLRADQPTPEELTELENLVGLEHLSKDFFETCDCDKIALDAASLIEQQFAEIETLHADVMELTMRLADKIWPEKPKEDGT